jgi:hypothetical protein
MTEPAVFSESRGYKSHASVNDSPKQDPKIRLIAIFIKKIAKS